MMQTLQLRQHHVVYPRYWYVLIQLEKPDIVRSLQLQHGPRLGFGWGDQSIAECVLNQLAISRISGFSDADPYELPTYYTDPKILHTDPNPDPEILHKGSRKIS